LTDIDNNVHAFLSVTKVKELLQEILAPILAKIGEEVKRGVEYNRQFDEINSKIGIQRKEFQTIQLKVRQVDELNR
jgi:hypothetical protein